MNNLYFIESDNFDILKIKVDEIIDRHQLSHDNLIVYDMLDNSIQNAIIELDTYSIFNDTKVVLCKNANFLTSSKTDINHNIDTLEKYLLKPNPNNILILASAKVDIKKTITKLVKKTCQIIDTNINLINYVQEKSQNAFVDDASVRYFLINTGGDLANIDNELAKLLEYKSFKQITKNDIDSITIKRIDCNIYDLIDAIISKDKKKSLKIYKEMINYGDDIYKIFVLLANQIRLIYQVKLLQDLTNDEICTKLSLKNVKQVQALRYKIHQYRSDDLLKYLHQLALIDEEIKTGKAIDQVALPIFIASL